MPFDDFDEMNDDFDNDFGVDSGISVDEMVEEDSGYSSDESDMDEVSFNDDGFNSSESEEDMPLDTENGNMANTNAKKTAGIAILIGIVIIVACFGLSMISKSLKAKRNAGSEMGQSSKTTYEYYDYNKKENKVSVNSDNVVSGNTDWIEFTIDENMKFNAKKSSEFTVINITNSAKVVNDNGDKIVKSTVKGYISGLIGTYEVEIPYDKAKYINEGTILKVEYTYTMRNDDLILNEINFQ